MKKKLLLGSLLLTGTTLLSWAPIQATFLHAPHDVAHGVGCVDCHEFHIADETSWGITGNTPDDTVKNFICLKCHGPSGSAPTKAMHSDLTINGTETWSTECTDCHAPHFQRQVSAVANISEEFLLSDIYLITGTIDAISPSGSNSTITYTLTSAATKWTNPATWSAKTDVGRGLIFVADALNPKGQTFETLSANGSSITVIGIVEPAMAGKTFGLLYGQFLKNRITTYLGDQVVSFYNPYGGFVDDSGSVAPTGICQVCHENTIYWTNDGTGSNHNASSKCTGCHSHDTGFTPGGGGDTNKHPNHLALSGVSCDTCHDTADFPYFKSGTDANDDGKFDLSETDVCATCHQDGTGSPATGLTSGWSDPGFSLGCNDCHGFGPDYPNGSPKANSHHVHGTNCQSCHNATTTTGNTITNPANHINGLFDVGPGNGITFTYSAGTCSDISCHQGDSADWGSTTLTLNCDSCHGYPPVPGDGLNVNEQFDGGKGTHVTQSYNPPSIEGGHIIFSADLDPFNDVYGSANTGYYECSKCHFGGVHANGIVEVQIMTDSWNKSVPWGNYERPLGFGNVGMSPAYQGVPGDPMTPKTCSNINCHFGATTPRWSCPGEE